MPRARKVCFPKPKIVSSTNVMIDWKATVKLIDLSTDDDGQGGELEVHMFYPEGLMKAMPKARCGDVLILQNVRVGRQFQVLFSLSNSSAQVQSRYGDISVMTNARQTKFALYTASILKQPGNATNALVPFPTELRKQPDRKETEYVSHLRANISKDNVPEEEEFIQMNIKSNNIKDKFQELKNVSDGNFYDLIVRVVKKPWEGGMLTTLWVSDYTSNSAFYDFSDTDAEHEADAAGRCPKGKMSMQISCFDEHIEHIREAAITKGTWVSIKNVQVKYGHMGSNLEGFVRGSQEDRRNFGSSIKITILHVDDREDLTPQHKAALERHRAYRRVENAAEKAKNQLFEDAAAAGRKRKASDMTMPPTKNAVSKRQAKRAAKRAREGKQDVSRQALADEATDDEAAKQKRMVAANSPMSNGPTMDVVQHSKQAARTPPTMGLNASGEYDNTRACTEWLILSVAVKCESHAQPPKTVAVVTQNLNFLYDVGENQKITCPLPFVNRKYRMDVRVRDFFPASLKDFARRKRIKRRDKGFDLLSNDGGSDVDVDSEGDDEEEDSVLWEWCFWLQLEDASPGVESKQSLWVLVDDFAGQCLTSEDASDLHENTDLLSKLRDTLFTLWGELEENKSAVDAARARKAKTDKREPQGEAPPPHSDDEDSGLEPKFSNKPFSCCVQQYGIKVPEQDPEKALDGKGHRWQRMFRLDGTRIV